MVLRVSGLVLPGGRRQGSKQSSVVFRLRGAISLGLGSRSLFSEPGQFREDIRPLLFVLGHGGLPGLEIVREALSGSVTPISAYLVPEILDDAQDRSGCAVRPAMRVVCRLKGRLVGESTLQRFASIPSQTLGDGRNRYRGMISQGKLFWCPWLRLADDDGGGEKEGRDDDPMVPEGTHLGVMEVVDRELFVDGALEEVKMKGKRRHDDDGNHAPYSFPFRRIPPISCPSSNRRHYSAASDLSRRRLASERPVPYAKRR